MRFRRGQQLIDILRNKKPENPYYSPQSSYAQLGEDLIIKSLFQSCLMKDKINYLDIGAHHSTWLSNTRLFYNQGSRGVLVEPDPVLYKEIKEHREGDICLNCGIGFENQENADFYVMEAPTLNTFSKEAAYSYQENKHSAIKEIIKIPLVKINDIIEKYFPDNLDFLSIDTEGLEMQILNSMDFEKHRPYVICIETAEYDTYPPRAEKRFDIIDFMKQKNYFSYVDTRLNTIFMDSLVWDKLKSIKTEVPSREEIKAVLGR